MPAYSSACYRSVRGGLGVYSCLLITPCANVLLIEVIDGEVKVNAVVIGQVEYFAHAPIEGYARIKALLCSVLLKRLPLGGVVAKHPEGITVV